MGRQDFETETLLTVGGFFDEPTHCLRADGFDASEDGTGRGTPLVPVAVHTTGAGFWQEGLGTLRGREQDSHENLIAIQAGCVRENPDSGPDGIGVRSDGIAYTLEARAEVQCVAFRAAGQDGFTPSHILPPVASTDGGGAGVPTIAFTCKDHGVDAGELSPTLRSMGHDGSHANAGGQVAVMTLAIRGRAGESSLEVREDGTANAILTPNGGRAGIGVGAVAIGWSEELTASEELAGTVQRGGDGGRHEGVMTPAMAVRRLTPEECEALQGFKRGYTKIDDKTADGPRYKALGNSFAVPVVAWIGMRIQMVEDVINGKDK